MSGLSIRRCALLAVLAAALLALPAAADAAPPVITETSFSAVTDTAATLEASVDPNGGKAFARFQYTTQADFEANGFSGPLTTSTPEIELPREVESTGDVTHASRLITGVTPPVPGSFGPGQTLGKTTGFPAAATIEKVTAEAGTGLLELEVSTQATATANGVTLKASGPQPISAQISGLTPGSAYRFRAAAHNTKVSPEEGTGLDTPFFTLAPTPTYGPCPNDTFRKGELSPFGSPGALLPDCRSYEQASPVNKDGGDVLSYAPYAKAAVDGGTVAYGSTFGAPGGEGAQEVPFFAASRGKAGWSSRGLMPPAAVAEKGKSLRGWLPDFSSTFASAIRLDNPLTEALYELHSDGSPPTLVAPFAPMLGDSATEVHNYAGAAADGSIVLFESTAQLAPEQGALPFELARAGAPNVYAWDKNTGRLFLASVLNSDSESESQLAKGAYAGPYDWVGGKVGRGGARASFYLSAEHAISDDGSVFFTSASDRQLYQRLNPTQPQSNPGPNGYVEDGHCAEPSKACTIHISTSHKTNGGLGHNGPDPAGSQPAAFMAASADGKVSYFTSPEKLTNDANTGPEQPPAQIGVADLSAPDPNATKTESLLPTHALGVAVDPAAQYIYWVEPLLGTIARAKLTADGSAIEGAPDPSFIEPGETEAITLPDSEPGVYHSAPSRPRYVAVGTCAEGGDCVYWTNSGPPAGEESGGVKPGGAVGGGGTIGRAMLTPDHSDIEGEPKPDFITGASNPQGIAVNATHIYWANSGASAGVRAIGRATTAGDEVNQAFIGASTWTPSGLALSGSEVFFSANNENGGVLSRAPLTGGTVKIAGVTGSGNEVLGVAVDSGFVYWGSESGEIGRFPLMDFVGEGHNCPVEPTCEPDFLMPEGQSRGLAIAGINLYWSSNGEAPTNPGNDLYRFRATGISDCTEPTGCLDDLTPDSTGNGAEVQGVLGASDDGSYVYFVANGDLDGPGEAEKGDCTRPLVKAVGHCNLYLWHEGVTSFITPINGSIEADGANLAQRTGGSGNFVEKTSFVSPDGKSLLFRSQLPLASYDGHEDLQYYTTHDVAQFYLYRYGRPLICVTCNPSGVKPQAAAQLSKITYPSLGPAAEGTSAVPSRHLSTDGSRVFFETTEALSAVDINGRNSCSLVNIHTELFACQDVYEWEAPGSGTCTEGGPGWSQLNQGCIYLISTGKSPYPSFFIDASESGDDVFFLTRDSLVGQDGDSIQDIYDARVGGGLMSQNAKPQPPCEVEGCLPNATPPPSIPAPPNITGPSDPKPKRCSKGKKCKKKHHKKKHKHRHVNAAKHRHHKRGAGER